MSRVVSSTTTVLSIMLLVFVAEMAVVGPIRHSRAQNVLYGEFRGQLAEGVAPTGQLDVDGKPLALGAPVALLRVPSLGIKEVVAEGTTSGVLMSGPGHRRDTPLPGQPGTSLILGRQATYGGPFGRLADIKIGAEIAVTTGQGNLLFKVTGIRRPGEKLVITDPNAARLTLVTGEGTPYLAENAIRVDAISETPSQSAPARPIGTSSLSASEDTMAGDNSGLLPLLLWSQLLLLLTALLAWVRTVWGRWQTWIVFFPVLTAVGFEIARPIAQLLPNLL